MPRGGARAGKMGKAYSNRTDLPGKLPISVAPSQHYGQAAASAEAQRQVPMGNPPVAQGGAQPTQPGGWQAGAPSPLAAAIQQIGIHPMGGATQRPNEPLTTGMASGPGAGPEVLAPPAFKPDPLVQASAAFSAIPASHMTPQMRALAAATQASARNASLPGIAQGNSQ